MNIISKILVSMVLISLSIFAWRVNINNFLSFERHLSAIEARAEESFSKRLFLQAIEYYKEALTLQSNIDYYYRIINVYQAYLAEEQSDRVRRLFLDDVLGAADTFPSETEFWLIAINLQMEMNRHNYAFSTIVRARRADVRDDELNRLYYKLLYSLELRPERYYDFDTSLNGFYNVMLSAGWRLITDTGALARHGFFDFISKINNEGYNIIHLANEIRLIDLQGIPRGRYTINAERSGMYSTQSSILPLHTPDGWIYITRDGEKLPGVFEMASSFVNREAAVKFAGAWHIIDEKGEVIEETEFTNIKFDLRGAHIQGGLVLAKKNGTYQLYNDSLDPISDSVFDDIDISLNGEPIAFSSGGKWGYIDNSGNVLLEPIFEDAKSFSNGLAAVKYNGLWGFINRGFVIAIEPQFEFAHYLTSSGSSIVREPGDHMYRIMTLPFYP